MPVFPGGELKPRGRAGWCPPPKPWVSPWAQPCCRPGPTDHSPVLQERLAVLDNQAGQIRAQAVQESERLAREKNASLQLLQKVPRSGWRGGGGSGLGWMVGDGCGGAAGGHFAGHAGHPSLAFPFPPRCAPPPRADSAHWGLQEKERLTVLEGRYHSLTGGRPFPKTTSTLKEVTSWAQP